MQRDHFIVLMDHDRWRAIHINGKQLIEVRAYSIDAENRTALLNWWQQFPQATVSFLSDLLHEHYHVEVLPYVRGAAALALLHRKLTAWPYAKDLYTACYLDHVSGIRKDSRLLFAALIYPAFLEWLPELGRRGVQLQRVCTQALLLPCWLPQFEPGFKHQVCLQYSPSRVRISYLYQRRLFFSRAIQLSVSADLQALKHMRLIGEQLGQVYQHLMQQHWIVDDAPLQMIWLGALPADIEQLQAFWPLNSTWLCVSESALAASLGEQSPSTYLSTMDWAAVKCILAGHTLPNLVPERMLLTPHVKQFKKRVHAAGILIVILLMLTNLMIWQGQNADELRLQWFSRQLDSARKPLLTADVLPKLRALTQAVNQVQSALRLPDRALSLLQQAMHGISQWRITQVSWSMADQPSSAQAANSPAWKEAVMITCVCAKQSEQAIVEWQELQHRFNAMPEIEKVEVVAHMREDMGAQRSGSTLVAPHFGQPQVLMLYLRKASRG